MAGMLPLSLGVVESNRDAGVMNFSCFSGHHLLEPANAWDGAISAIFKTQS
jgi:hypothetical protein